MAESTTKLPIKHSDQEAKRPSQAQPWRRFDNLRQEVDRLFEDVESGFWPTAFRRSFFDVIPSRVGRASWGTPAVDIVDKGTAFEVTAELPGVTRKASR